MKPRSSWKKKVLKPVDAVRYRDAAAPGWWRSHVASYPVAENATDVHIVKKGWDVEHCYICLARIGRKGDPFGYFCKSENQWGCAPCYKSYIGPHDLAFLIRRPPRR
jgi:hypothetical protein